MYKSILMNLDRTKPFKYWKIDKGKSSILYMSIPSHIPEIHNSHDRNRSGKFSFLIFSNFCCGDHCDKMHSVCSFGECHFEFGPLPFYIHFSQVSNRKCRTLVKFWKSPSELDYSEVTVTLILSVQLKFF